MSREERGGESNGRDLMEYDMDMDLLQSWPLDPISFFAYSPQSFFFSEDYSSAASTFTTNGAIIEADGNEQPFQIETQEEARIDSLLIRERLNQALRFLKESEPQVLVQVWAPVKHGDMEVLTTSDQPFVLDHCSIELVHYRTTSMKYLFSVTAGTNMGLPGRVFRQQRPEWSPNVQLYDSKEFPRVNDAVQFNVQGTVALPVLDPSGSSCFGVVELIMTSSKFNYGPDIDKVCKALEAVNLKSYDVVDHPPVQICNEGRQSALAEVLEVLSTVCETYKLPLAQTWIPCRNHDVKKNCSSFDENNTGEMCMSTSDVAVYIIDPHMWCFRDACVEHHLRKGQGVAGRVFEHKSAYFSSDVTRFSKTDYPLVHYARMFGLVGCLSVCLQSSFTGADDYILEFFLPPDIKEASKQQALLDSMMDLMKTCFRSLRMISDIEPQEGKSIINVCDVEFQARISLESGNFSSNGGENAQAIINHLENEENLVINLVTVVNTEENGKKTAHLVATASERKPGRKRGKAEKSISLEVLQQYFSGSLKDAAKNLGVCPTTMKRICRQHGISRWPSRKINKVNRSLSKLQQVIESVQGAEGAFNLPSFTCSIPVAANFDDHSKNESIPETNKDNNSKSSTGDGSSDSQSSEEVNAEHNNSIPDVAIEEPEQLLGGILVEDSGSSKDLRNLCNLELDDSQYEQEKTPAITIPLYPTKLPEIKTVTIKASYRDDIIRFRLPCGSGMTELNEEVSKRLKLDIGTFEIKYFDDDQEWVILACNADLEECLEIAKLSGVHIIRLQVHEISSFLGSSCGSSD